VSRTRRNAEPPQGGLWDEPLERVPFAFVDLEMTGLDEKRDRVLQVCIERVVGGQLTERFLSYIDPERVVTNGAVHGIGEAELAGAPTFAEVGPRLRALLEGAVFVAHGAKFDLAFLEAEFARAGTPWEVPYFIDTLHLSRRAYNFKSHRLALLAAELGIECPAAHRADNDVRVLRALFDKLLPVLTPTTPRDLWHVRTGLAHARPEILAELEQARVKGTPLRLRYRPAGRAVQEFPFHVTTMRTDLDPPIVIGYLSHTRGRRELRIDRILSLEPATSPGSTP
jgi:DNA polymerase-3 subunit epsilon